MVCYSVPYTFPYKGSEQVQVDLFHFKCHDLNLDLKLDSKIQVLSEREIVQPEYDLNLNF